MSQFVEIKAPCPVCGESRRCKHDQAQPDDLITCFRRSDETVGEFRRVKQSDQCCVFVRIDSPADGRNGNGQAVTAKPSLDTIARRHAAKITDAQVDALAAELGVSADSLRAIGVGHTGREFCFPERDATGKVTAINKRCADGVKRVAKGEHRGLIVPAELATMMDPVLVVEGPSDVAACQTMGLTAVGRPNNLTGANLIVELLRGRELIVVGERDQKADGTWPGRKGATKIGQRIAQAWKRDVRWALPPEGVKDAREYLQRHADEDPAEVGRQFLAHIEGHSETIEPRKPEADGSFRQTDLGNSERLADQFRDRIRWTKGLGWLVTDQGRRWKTDNTGEVHRLAMKTVRNIYTDADKLDDDARRKLIEHALKSENAARINAIVELAKHFGNIAIDDADLDRDQWAFNVINGTIDIHPESGEYNFREHRREDLITKLAPVTYDKSAECPRFDKFISEIFQHDADLVQFAQRALGSCLIGAPEEVLQVWHGGGDNGKTTLAEAINNVFGDYATTMPQNFLAQKLTDSIPTDVMDLRGARLAMAHEPDQRMVLDESKVKYLTGRDRIKARRLYHDLVTFEPTHKLVLVTNHKPTVKTQTRAIWRRIKLWPFEFTVPKESKDRALGEKLKAEASGILNWLLIGAAEWVAAGRDCDPPACVQDATVEYKAGEDLIGDWLDECTQRGPTETPFRDLYGNYETWARANGFEKPLSKKKLSTLLEEHGFRRRTVHGRRIVEGIGVNWGDDG